VKELFNSLQRKSGFLIVSILLLYQKKKRRKYLFFFSLFLRMQKNRLKNISHSPILLFIQQTDTLENNNK